MEMEIQKITEMMKKLFVNREDVFSRQFLNKNKKKGFKLVKEPLTLELIEKHLNTQDYLGVYQLDGSKVKWGCWDFDLNTKEDYENAIKLHKGLTDRGFHPLLEKSGGGDYKVHLWIFSEESIPAKQMKDFMERCCEMSKVSPHEIFPKQTELAEDEYGNLLKLPLGEHLETKRKSIFVVNSKELILPDDVIDTLDYHVKNKDQIPILTEQKKIESIEIKDTPYEFDKFFNEILKREIPSGITKKVKIGNKEAGINNNLLKNQARWFYEKGYTEERLKKEVKPIFDKNKWAFADLKGWFIKCVRGHINEIQENELVKYCEDYSPDLLKFLPSYKPEDFDKLEVYSFEDMKTYVPEPQQWLIENQIPKAEIGFLVGKRGERKTYIALLLSLCLASGKKCMEDEVPEKKKVLWLEEETGKDNLTKRTMEMAKGMEIDKEELDIRFISYSGLKLDNSELDNTSNKKFAEFRKIVAEFKPDLIIDDCLQRSVNFEVDKDNASISKFFTEIVRPMTRAYGCSWLFIHHLRKGVSGNTRNEDPLDEVRGGSELVNYARFVLSCSVPKHQQSNDSEMVVFRVLKMSNSQKPPAKVISFTDTKEGLKIVYEGEPSEVLAGEVQCGNAIQEYLFDKQLFEFQTKDINDVAEEIGFKKTLISSGLKYLKEKGFLKSEKRGHYKIAGDNPSKSSDSSYLNIKKEKVHDDDMINNDEYNKKEGLNYDEMTNNDEYDGYNKVEKI